MSTARYTEQQKMEILRRYVGGESEVTLAKEFGCHHSYPALLSKRKWHAGLIQETRGHQQSPNQEK